MEIWKTIEDYPDYQVSSLGRVKSLKGKKERILKPGDVGGYLNVILSNNGKKKNFRVHRLVAEAFLLNPLGLPVINHKDEDKTNNTVDNLEWCDSAYNNNYSHAKPVFCIELNKLYSSATIAAEELDLCRVNITKCCNGKRKTCGNYHFRFATPEETLTTPVAGVKQIRITIDMEIN